MIAERSPSVYFVVEERVPGKMGGYSREGVWNAKKAGSHLIRSRSWYLRLHTNLPARCGSITFFDQFQFEQHCPSTRLQQSTFAQILGVNSGTSIAPHLIFTTREILTETCQGTGQYRMHNCRSLGQAHSSTFLPHCSHYGNRQRIMWSILVGFRCRTIV